MPGDALDVAAGSKLIISAEAYGHSGQAPLRSVEIVGHGKVLARSEGKDAAHLTVDLELPADHGIWIAAKCDAGRGQVAHATPVYVSVNGGGWDNPRTLRRNLGVPEGYLKEVERTWRIRGTIWIGKRCGIGRSWRGRSPRRGVS
jgi:hypothetical protein